MRVRRCFQATDDIDQLLKTYRTIRVHGIKPFETLLQNDVTFGHERYGGLKLQRGAEAAAIYKARVLLPELGGKRDGPRYIYERLLIDGEAYAIALHVYVHQQGTRESMSSR